MTTILEQRVRELTADPNHYPQTSRAESQDNADWILSHATKLSTEWLNVSANVSKGDPDLFWVAETLTAWGLAEARKEPKNYVTRYDYYTDTRKRIGVGCVCYFRLKPEVV